VTPVVIDASVVAAAFLPEPDHAAARAVLTAGAELRAPELLLAEIGNVVWKRSRRGELAPDEAEELLAAILRVPIHYSLTAGLLGSALALALRTGRTVYDCLYLALAVRDGLVMVTGDLRLVQALAGTPLARHVASVQTFLPGPGRG
jgi:predicted nucleic acid-binding protein